MAANAASHSAPPELLRELRPLADLLAANRRRRQVFALVACGAWLAVGGLLPLAAAIGADIAWQLPAAGRFLAAAGWLTSFVVALRVCGRYLRSWQMSDDAVALAIENEAGRGVENRLINAVQLSRPGNDPTAEVRQQVVRENLAQLRETRLPAIVAGRTLLFCLSVTMVILGAGAAFYWQQPAQVSQSAARVLLPFAAIEPAYRTRLIVRPGDAEVRGGKMALEIEIVGERPHDVQVETREVRTGDREQSIIKAPEEATVIRHKLGDVLVDTEYRVRGGDFHSRWYRLTVPQRVTVTRLRGVITPPEYIGKPPRNVDNTSGEVEAIAGSHADLTWEFSQPMKSVQLHVRASESPTDAAPIAATLSQPTAAAGQFTIAQSGSYSLTATDGRGEGHELGPFTLRALADQPPRLELVGIDPRTEYDEDAQLPLRLRATDDHGLKRVELVFRSHAETTSTSDDPTAWRVLQTWDAQGAHWEQAAAVRITELTLAEGERGELALRAQDNAPNRAPQVGGVTTLKIGGDESRLQRLYERLLTAQRDLAATRERVAEQQSAVTTWLRKLEGADATIRWDDPQQVAGLHSAVAELAQQQEALQTQAIGVAALIPADAGNLKLGLGLLAEAELTRVRRILESVPSRELPPQKQSALADARITLERIGRSLDEMQEKLAEYRSDWELNHTLPLLKSLADRQRQLRERSAEIMAAVSETSHWQTAMARRQTRVQTATGWVAEACRRVALRLEDEEVGLAAAFQAAVDPLQQLQPVMLTAAEGATAGKWPQVVAFQTSLATRLATVHAELKRAHDAATQETLAALRERAKSDKEAQRALANLPPGTNESAVKNFPNAIKLQDTLRLRDIAAGKKKPTGADSGSSAEAFLGPIDAASLELAQDSGVRQDPGTLSLGNTPEKTARYGDLPPLDERNKVQPFIQEEFEDLVGKLLDEADELGDQYQTLALSTNQNNNDPGEVMKNGGRINSTGAVAATGNKKPPVNEAGGVARTGRQGARATGAVADSEAFDRRGRDQALDGQQEIADQTGTLKMKKSDDPQGDTSTGVGGKKVESDDTHFSLHDAGKWKDEYLRRLEKPQAKQSIVERAGDKLDPQAAAQLRDLASRQEQAIERLKAIRKELRTLYLPTEHLDELAATLTANLERLQEQPDPELFRLQRQTLDRLRGALRVFQSAVSHLQTGSPRERQVQGRALDQPARQPLVGYEEAVRSYYSRLTEE